MAFLKKNFALISGAELSADTLLPRIFSYHTTEDTIADINGAPHYFGLGITDAAYDERESMAVDANVGSLILVSTSAAGTGTPPFQAVFRIDSPRTEAVVINPLTAWTP